MYIVRANICISCKHKVDGAGHEIEIVGKIQIS